MRTVLLLVWVVVGERLWSAGGGRERPAPRVLHIKPRLLRWEHVL